METRSQLDIIEDTNFAVDQYVYKGKPLDEVKSLLHTRGVDDTKMLEIINFLKETYKGPRRIESNKTVRFFNFAIDMTIVCSLIIFSLVKINNIEVFFLVLFLIPFAYFAFPESKWGVTVGKLITGSVVVDEGGKIPDFRKALIRTICRIIPFDKLTLVIGDRVLHDKLSKTFVVNRKFLKTHLSEIQVDKKYSQ
jgi:hypothetical protein